MVFSKQLFLGPIVCYLLAYTDFVESLTCGQPLSDALFKRGQRMGVDVPWNALLTMRNELSPDRTYATILISPNLVLSTANHFGKAKPKIHPFNSYFITVGTPFFGDPANFVDYGRNTSYKPFSVNITHIRFHPKYSNADVWQQVRNPYALIHLAEDVPFRDGIQPLCLPTSDDEGLIQALTTPSPDPKEEETILSGWNRDIPENMFLRLKIESRDKCEEHWKGGSETNPYSYQGRFCALVGYENDHSSCVHKDIGSYRYFNGSFYFTGLLNNFYSTNKSRICDPEALHYFMPLDTNLLRWIEQNQRCGPKNFTCTNGQCVPYNVICDQKADCADKSDEDSYLCKGMNFCGDEEFQCGIYGPCISIFKVNNGVKDCPDGSDEQGYIEPLLILFVALATVLFVVILIIISTLWRKNVSKLKKEIRNLTGKEVDDFLFGIPQSERKTMNRDGVYVNQNYLNNVIHCLPWNTEYEVPFDRLKIGHELNRGRFGVVYKAHLLGARNPSEEEDVALKTNLECVGVTEFKVLLTELKILCFIGDNENVVRFLGACTENIINRKVYVIMEYCENGSLKEYLDGVNASQSFVDLNKGTDNGLGFRNSQYLFTDTYDLMVWSTQIASGMEYLASRKIVHGDLAARNVLLNSSFDAKLSDFGLSMQAEGNGLYQKSSQTPIPWRWLAIEALKSKTFSEKSDVWAFGVTLFEVFSLGMCPYSNYVEWSDEFIQGLESGMRLPQPEYASDEMYKILCCCWKESPHKRPTFTNIRNTLAMALLPYQSQSRRGSATSSCDSGLDTAHINFDSE